MLGKTPVTREELLEVLERPENADLKRRVFDDSKYTEIIIELALLVDTSFDSFEDFKNYMDQHEQIKKTVNA